VTDDKKDEPTEARLGQQPVNGPSSVPAYEIAALAIREKTARLRALRLAREAELQKSAPPAAPKRSASGRAAGGKKSAKASSVPLSQWLDDQKDSGRSS
jgi:hypothetical protein